MLEEIILLIALVSIPILVVLYENERDKEFDEWLKEVYGEDCLEDIE